jgi:hypothetical protein
VYWLHKTLAQVLSLVTVALLQTCTAQDCESLKSATPEAIVSALDHGDIKTEDCSRIVFRRIEQFPKDQSIPILISHLGSEWPASNAPHGLRPRSPSVESLCNIGLSAEPSLIEFLARNEDEGSIEHANAIEALALIRHFDVVPTIKLLRKRSLELADTPAGARLEAALSTCLGPIAEEGVSCVRSSFERPIDMGGLVAASISELSDNHLLCAQA